MTTEQDHLAELARLAAERELDDAEAAALGRAAGELANRIMALASAASARREVHAAALWRCLAGLCARGALDHGGGPAHAQAALLMNVVNAADLAAELVSVHRRRAH